VKIARPFIAGTVINCVVTGAACAYLDPNPVAWPALSLRHPLESYLALARAPYGNWVTLAVQIWLVFAVCFGVAVLAAARQARRRASEHAESENLPSAAAARITRDPEPEVAA
jgi:hypothetical protein